MIESHYFPHLASAHSAKQHLYGQQSGFLRDYSRFRVESVVFFAWLAKALLRSRAILPITYLVFHPSTIRALAGEVFLFLLHSLILSYSVPFVHSLKNEYLMGFLLSYIACICERTR